MNRWTSDHPRGGAPDCVLAFDWDVAAPLRHRIVNETVPATDACSRWYATVDHYRHGTDQGSLQHRQTPKTFSGCTSVLMTPNPTGGGPNRDGNWEIAYPYPSTLSPVHGLCGLSFVRAWVDTRVLQAPFDSWLPNSASTASEWITPYDGEGNQPRLDVLENLVAQIKRGTKNGKRPPTLRLG
jgi:hypothetical protein